MIKPPMLTGKWHWVGMLVVAVCLSGCSGGSSVETYEVTGTITYNDKPVANVGVTFNPDGEGLAATGKTDAQGKFSSLRTGESGDGVAEGTYTVTLSTVSEASTDLVEDANAYADTTPEDLPFPTKYLNTAESDLKATISPDGEKNLTFTLKD